MKILVLSTLSLLAQFAAARGELPKEKLTLIRTIPHSGYSEGLDFYEGFLWHTLPKEILKIDPKDGSIVARFPPASEYNESLMWFKGMLYVLSYSDNGIYRGKLEGAKLQFERVGTTPEAHGWGITHDGTDIYITGNYSRQIYRMNPKDFSIKSTTVAEISDVEDLAWDGDSVWASSFTAYRGSVFRINIKTGKIASLYELPDAEQCPVIDGIAKEGNTLWITGKNCPAIFNVKIPSAARLIVSKK